jgi:hypothetical protein
MEIRTLLQIKEYGFQTEQQLFEHIHFLSENGRRNESFNAYNSLSKSTRKKFIKESGLPKSVLHYLMF